MSDGNGGYDGSDEVRAARITAFVLGELHGDDRTAFEQALETDAALRSTTDAEHSVASRIPAVYAAETEPGLRPLSRERVVRAAGPFPLPWWRRPRALLGLAAACVLAAGMMGVAGYLLRGRGVAIPGVGGGPLAISQRANEGSSDHRGSSPEPVLRDEEVVDHIESDEDLEESFGEDGLSDARVYKGKGGARERVQEKVHRARPPFHTEGYDRLRDNPFIKTDVEHTSTFSVDVDTASYANVRRFLERQGRRPVKDAVRIEELLNYFPYDYEPPPEDADHPFAHHTAVAECPWEPEHRLVRVALKGKVLVHETRPAANLVFLLDVSGSMDSPLKLPLLQKAMRLLVDELRPLDRVAIVVYAGAAGLVLDATPGSEKDTIREAIDRLRAGGSTNGGAGIELAYQVAKDSFIEGGANRVLLCTDGDFNVGVSDRGSLTRLIEEKAKTGVFLTVLGFGTGNLKDDRMEELSNVGNGNYAYVDGLREARKVLVEEGLGTLVTIAQDVKIQVAFNPAKVAGWRLIGYENRLLKNVDFKDDTKDAGEIGAGHAVTALYQIVPAGVALPGPTVDPNPFVGARGEPSAGAPQDAVLQLRLRYKEPGGTESTPLEAWVVDEGTAFADADVDFQWAAAVAAFGMMLRDSPHKGACTWAMVEEIAQAARGEDDRGYRAEFVQLVRLAETLTR